MDSGISPQCLDLSESTTNATIKIKNISFDILELYNNLECNRYVLEIKIPENYKPTKDYENYKRYKYYAKLDYKKKTKRGRKKNNNNIKKKNKCFGTCIQIEIIMYSKKLLKGDEKYFDKSFTLNSITYYPEVWKIKLFRNGTITVCGVKDTKMDNFIITINYFIKYIQRYLKFSDNDVGELLLGTSDAGTKLNNYKTIVIDYKIDIYLLEKYFINYFSKKCYISINNLIKAIKTPSIIDMDDFTWKNINKLSNNFQLNYDEMFMRSLNINDKEIAIISKENLILKLKSLNIKDIYMNILLYLSLINQHSYINYSNTDISHIVETIIYESIKNEMHNLTNELLIKEGVSISRIAYNSNKYSSLLIYFNVWINENYKNVPVVKIFPSGKINIDGCCNKDVALLIFDWIKKLLIENPDFVWNEKTWGKNCYLDTEFSMSDSE